MNAKGVVVVVSIGLTVVVVMAIGILLVNIGTAAFPTDSSEATTLGIYLMRVGVFVMVLAAGIGLVLQLMGLVVSPKVDGGAELAGLEVATVLRPILDVAKDLVLIPGGIGLLILVVGALLAFGSELA